MSVEGRPATWDAIIAMSKAPDRLTLVSIANRPGSRRYFMMLEYELFPPGSPLNSEFEYFFVAWPTESPITWTVAVMPLLKFPEARRIAKDAGMRIANGVPRMLIGGSPTTDLTFPVNHSRVWTLENDPGSPVYYPHGDEFIRAEEQRWIEAFMTEKHGPNWREGT